MSSITFIFTTLVILVSALRTSQYCYPVTIEHGFVDVIDHRIYKFFCADGYILEGEHFIDCKKNPIKDKPKCIKPLQSISQYCNPIEEIEHGFVEITDGKYYKFSCDEGYILQGQTFVECDKYLMNGNPKCAKHVCADLPNPENGQVHCKEGPLIPGKSCRFSCFDGYALQGSQITTCKFNLQWSRLATCSLISKISTLLVCEKPSDFENGKVECDEGDLTLGKVCRFSCLHGYKLEGARVRRCMFQNKWSGNVKCVRIPEQSYSEPEIENRKATIESDRCEILRCDQLCLKIGGSMRCKCCPGYVLNLDNTSCKLNNESRANKNKCLETHGRVGSVVFRKCPHGYTFDYERNDCIEKVPRLPTVSRPTSYSSGCEVKNGGCEHLCQMKNFQTVTCTCRDGYELHQNGKNCIDIDECSRDNPCEHYCNNIQGSYFCSCRPSYILVEGSKCKGCRRNSYWSYERNACTDCPRNSHTDSEGRTSLEDCVCDSGYTGDPGKHITCEDIDECSIDNFDCSHTCVNSPGDAYCLCPKGFMLDTNNKTCIDTDECTIKNGGCEGLCINTNGGFRCDCLDGFTLSKRDSYSCDDIDECSENNGGCEHLCINYRGGFYCACKDGYRLDRTLKNCTDIQCPKLPLPHYSYMICSYENKALSEKNNYPVNTKCTFRCLKGYKNAQSGNKVKCAINGTWTGDLPECKPQNCPPLKAPENGEVYPLSCSIHGASAKQKCTFSCHAGYILEGSLVFTCKNNLAWSIEDIPVCNLVNIPPIIKCPNDMQVTLLPGEAVHNITIKEPTTNAEYYEVSPSWVNINYSVEFPVGVTHVIFTAISTFKETAQCEMTVTVLDKEPPTFHSCPDPIVIEGAKGSGEFVTWEKPYVTDNVELVNVFSLLEPNTTLTPGTYFVEYVAKDASGNIGTCSFDISIKRMKCTDLRDPEHGIANCMDWMFGKLCNPQCDDGYMRDPEDSLYYSCDDTGLWEPSDYISECLKYTLATELSCQDGFEFRNLEVTGEDVCIECPSYAAWSSTTKKCTR